MMAEEDSLRFDTIPTYEDVDIIVLDVLQSDRSTVCVDEADCVDDKSVHGHTLGSCRGFEAFHRIESLKWGIGI
jgi:hypothetical protein